MESRGVEIASRVVARLMYGVIAFVVVTAGYWLILGLFMRSGGRDQMAMLQDSTYSSERALYGFFMTGVYVAAGAAVIASLLGPWAYMRYSKEWHGRGHLEDYRASSKMPLTAPDHGHAAMTAPELAEPAVKPYTRTEPASVNKEMNASLWEHIELPITPTPAVATKGPDPTSASSPGTQPPTTT